MNRRNFLATVGAVAASVPLLGRKFAGGCGYTRIDNYRPDNQTLHVHAARRGIVYGSEAVGKELRENRAYAAAFARECAILVPGVETKWKALRPTPTTYDFSGADWLLQFATLHGLLFRGHTLVWHDALPDWFWTYVTTSNARQVLIDHIRTVAGHYAGKVQSWDVVNEGIQPQDGQPGGLRNSPWLQLVGPDYIELAFREAAKADPEALLVYNEANLEYDSPEIDLRRADVLQLLTRLKKEGVPLHALGIQGHLQAGYAFSSEKLQRFMQEVTGLGLKLLISEMDVGDYSIHGSVELRKQAVAQEYARFLSAALRNEAVIATITWGVSDRYTWLAPRADHQPIHPLPLDEKMNRNPAWYAMAQCFDEAPGR